MIGMLMQVCAAFGDDVTHCDVRVKYDTAYESVKQCDQVAKTNVVKMVAGMEKNDPELVVFSFSGACFTRDALKVKLNDLPEFMDAIGRTYQMSFY